MTGCYVMWCYLQRDVYHVTFCYCTTQSLLCDVELLYNVTFITRRAAVRYATLRVVDYLATVWLRYFRVLKALET